MAWIDFENGGKVGVRDRGMGVYTVEIEGKASFEARLSRKLYLNSKSRNQLYQMLGKILSSMCVCVCVCVCMSFCVLILM